jgi:hypothetical protein
MKRTIFTVLSVVVLLTLAVGSVFAASTTKTLSTNFTLVNLDDTNRATGTIQYVKDYSEGGATWAADAANTQFDLDPNGGSVQIRQYFDTTLTAGKGSVVVNSSAQLGSIAQVLARSPQTPTRGAYTGFTSGDNKFYVPLVAHQGSSGSGTVNSQIIIQNIESSSQDVTVELIGRGTSGNYTKTISALQAGASYYYDLADETNLSTNWFGSAAVTGATGKNITVVSNLFMGSDGMQTFDAFPSSGLTNKWVAPLFLSRLNNKLTTVISVQNLSGGTIAAGGLALTCTHDPSHPELSDLTGSNTTEIVDKGNYDFNSNTDTATFPANWYGSCSVDAGAGKNIIGFVQLRYVGAGSNAGTAAYEMVPATGAAQKVVVPLVLKRLPNGFATVVTVQNLGSAETTLTFSYTPNSAECPASTCDKNGDGSVNASDVITVTKTLAGNASIQRNYRLAGTGSADEETDLPSNWTGSLVISSSDTAINGFSQITDYLSPVGDTFMAYNAFTR